MLKLYDYQTDLVNQTRLKLKQGHTGVLIQSPAGSGKSLVIAEIARLTTARGGRVLFLVHRVEIMKQIKIDFERQGVDVSLCYFKSPTSVLNSIESICTPKLIITDESHHSNAQTYQRIYEHFHDVIRLGFTATPWQLNGKGFETTYSAMVLGKTVEWLIDNQRLAPFRMWTTKPLYNHDKLKKSRGDYSSKSINEALNTDIAGEVVSYYNQYAPGSKAILYAPSIKLSQHFADDFSDNGIRAVHVDAKTPKKEREQIMEDFKIGKIKVLCNVDLVSEGFNVPDCDCTILTRPTASLVLYTQQAMRSMRYQPNKVAKIIDCADNYTRFGTPKTPHEWSLKGRVKRSNNEQDELQIMTCDSCMAVFEQSDVVENRCPYCGELINKLIQAKKERELIEAELQEVRDTASFDLNDCKNISEVFRVFEARKSVEGNGKRPVFQAVGYWSRKHKNWKQDAINLCHQLNYDSKYINHIVRFFK